MAKLKVKDMDEKLILTGAEIRLVAALSMLRALSESGYTDEFGAYDHGVKINHTIEQEDSGIYVTYEVGEDV